MPTMLRRYWTSITTPLLPIFLAALCLGQAVPSRSSSSATSGAVSGAPPASPTPATVDDDEDSPDIPPIARGRISEEEYLRLRDQHIGMLRGVADLARNPHARSQAIRKMEGQEQSLRRQRSAALGATGQAAINLLGPTWTPLGPDPIPNGQTSPSEVAVSGRVTAIAIDPSDATGNAVYVGTAQGGLYRSLDGGATWTALMDTAQSLAIGAISIDPLDHTKLFVGTGEGNFSGDSFFGVGLYIISNANSTNPSTPPSFTGPFNAPAASNPDVGVTDVFTGRSITQILVNPTNDSLILVSTSSGLSGASGDPLPGRPPRGVYFSNNALSATPTFTRLNVQASPPSTLINRPVTDMVMDPGDPTLILISVFGQTGTEGGVWSSPSTVWSGTGTWTQVLQITTLQINGKFAVNRSTGATPVTTFLLAQSDSNMCSGKTVNGTLHTSNTSGMSWTELTAARGFCGGQCFYDMPVAVDPTNASNIFIGGSAPPQTGGIGSCGSGILGKSTDAGAHFAPSQNLLHADSHAIAIHPTKPLIMYEGNDGGIFRSADGGTTWTSVNTTGFNATQFESLAVHPTDPTFTIGGTQDNGTPFLQPNGSWTRADFGDGGFSAIDQNATDTTNVTMYHTYFNISNNLVGYADVTAVSSATEGSWNFNGCQGRVSGAGITCGDTVLFYAPLALGPGTPNTVYFGTDRLYRSTNNGAMNTVVSQAPLVAGTPISAIGISPTDDNFRIVGLGEDANGNPNGHVFATTTGSSTLTDVTGTWPPMYIARAVIDPNSKTTAYITLDGYGTQANPVMHVWKTTNLSDTAGVTTWTAASTGLPDVPVNALAVDPTNSNLLYVGTDIGVFNSTDDGATWNPYGAGLPRVAVFDLKITAGHKVRIATHGRGMWEITAATALATTTGLLASTNNTTFGTPVTFTATVNTGGNPTPPTGNITFLDGTTSLGTATLNVSGQAAFTTSALSVASHSITAQYSGDFVYAPSTSSAQVINVSNAPNADYSLNIPSGSATVHAGTSATYTINLTATNGFTGSVNFSCTSGVPSLANCLFNPTTVALSGSPASTTLTITTTAPTAAPPANNLGSRLATGSGFFALALVLGLTGRRRRRQRTLWLTLGLLAFTAGLISCGGGGGSNVQHNPGTPPGTYTITISATSGSTTHTSTITLTVQ